MAGRPKKEFDEMNVENLPIDSLKPYKNNQKIHTKEQIQQIAESLKRFGWRQQIVVDKDNVIVIGHGRYLAAKSLGYAEVPCSRIEDLSESEINALRIIDNKTNESQWDFSRLDNEIQSLSDEFDFEDFGINLDDLNDIILEKEEKHQQEKDDYMVDLAKIENIHKGIFEGVGKYDMPVLEPVTELPPIKEWISFNYVLSDKNPEGKAVHFFIDDYQFERVWRQPEKYLDKLKRYVCVATPDFSPYSDMPLILQMYSHYKKQWVGRWLQYNGVTVIPTIRSSTDKRSFEWYLDGIPKGGIVIMSSMWCDSRKDEKQNESDRYEYEHMKEVIQPKKIFIYGRKSEKMGILDTDNIEYITNFSDRRWNNGER